MRKSVLVMALAAVMLAPGAAWAQSRRLHCDLSLGPSTSIWSFGGLQTNGLALDVPDEGDSVGLFGANLGLGFFATPVIEPGFMLDFAVVVAGGDGAQFGLRPFLKLNLWSSAHVNPFFQPFLGFRILSDGDTVNLFDGGFFAGVDLLVTTWGIRLWTGFEVLANGAGHDFAVPVQWALFAYF